MACTHQPSLFLKSPKYLLIQAKQCLIPYNRSNKIKIKPNQILNSINRFAQQLFDSILQISKMPITPFFIFILFLYLGYTTILDITQPSIVTWSKNNSTSVLLITSIDVYNWVLLREINSLPYNLTLDEDTFNILAYGPKNATIYISQDVIHTVNVNYYYKSYNGQIEVSNLTSTVNESQSDPLLTNSLETHFSIQAAFIHSQSQFPKSSILFGTDLSVDQNIYMIPNWLYSNETKCGTLSPIGQKMKDNFVNCIYLSPQQIISDKFYINSFPNEVTEYNEKDNQFSLPFTNAILTLNFAINPDLMGTNLKIQSLSSYQIDLKQVSLSVKTIKSGSTYMLSIIVSNQGTEIAVVRIQCTQGIQTIYDQFVVVQAKQQVQFTTSLSKTAPYDDINFKIINPVTSQFYLFTKPASIVQDTSQTSYRLQGTVFTSETKVPISVIIGGAIGFIVFVFICFSCVYWYKRKKRLAKLKLENLRYSTESAVNPSQRDLVNPQQRVIKNVMKDDGSRSTATSLPPPDNVYVVRNPVTVKEKRQTFSTLDSENLGNQHQRNETEQKVPSIQDKMEFRQPIDDLQMPKVIYTIKSSPPAKIQRRHKKTPSTLPILPPLSESIQYVDPDIEGKSQKLEHVRM